MFVAGLTEIHVDVGNLGLLEKVLDGLSRMMGNCSGGRLWEDANLKRDGTGDRFPYFGLFFILALFFVFGRFPVLNKRCLSS
jgi:hypothetical protein